MSSSSDPDWSLLPREPERFFGLESGFDRKQLKRAYNERIRVFKPEKFPDEFQTIRSAFEQLDNQLRYGQTSEQFMVSFPSNSDQGYEWSSSTGSSMEAQSASKPPTLQSRLKTEQPVEVFQWLKKTENKSPYEYFAVAALSDVVKKDPALYFQWLLTGLRDHPNDPGLIELVREFLLRSHADADLVSLVAATSKVVNSDRFYYLTEKAWLGLLGRIEFAKFKTLLSRCESRLNIHSNHAQIVFYCELLKASILIADESWVNEKFDLLQSSSLDDHPFLDHELSLLDALIAYRQQHQAQHQTQHRCAVRDRIHVAIKSYFTLDEAQGDAAIIDCQTYFVENAQSLLDAFAWGQETASPMVMLWMYINHDVTDRHEFSVGTEVDERSTLKQFKSRVRDFLNDLDSSIAFDGIYLMKFMGYQYGIGVVAFSLPFLAMLPLIAFLEVSLVLGCGVAAGVAMFIVTNYFIYPRWIESHFVDMVRKAVLKDYRRWWRGRFVQLFDATHATMDQMLPVVHDVLTHHAHFSGAITWTPQLLNEDVGLLLYALAVPYRR